ncbi:hypothetical protein KR026_001495, partial [Drosophila bipectinata]
SLADTSVSLNENRTSIETTNYGPVTMVVDNLAEIAVNVSDESTDQLQAKMNRTGQDISGNIEVLTTNALAQLSDVLFETSNVMIANPDCNPTWSLDEVNENVTSQVNRCTDGLVILLEDFRQSGQQAIANVQEFVQKIAQLPAQCQMLNVAQLGPLATIGGNVCFINGMAEINVGMAQSMHNASLLMVRTHQAAEEQVILAEQCLRGVVQEIGDYLRQEQDQCLQ